MKINLFWYYGSVNCRIVTWRVYGIVFQLSITKQCRINGLLCDVMARVFYSRKICQTCQASMSRVSNKFLQNCSAEVKAVRCCAGVYPNCFVNKATESLYTNTILQLWFKTFFLFSKDALYNINIQYFIT